LESHRLLASILFGLTLNDQLNIIFFVVDRVSQKLLVFMPILHLLWLVETVLDLAGLVADGINHLPRLNHVPLVEQRAIGLFFDTLDALRVLVI
tara:strand:+ start:723 stop:1004 length:282 start_codon:yes stop_codon:yes gene_type:complete